MSEFPHGSGIFETIKTVDGVPKFLSLHLMRAVDAAKFRKMKLPTMKRIESEIFDHIVIHPVKASSGRLRVEFTNSGRMKISHAPYEPWVDPAKLTITSSRIDERSRDAGIKALPYIENLELLERARAAGFDEVIRFNSRNQISEGATSNLLLKIDGKWVTPNLSSGCLPGITRALCLKWFSITERVIDRDELADVEAAFILSSLREVQPASCIGPHELSIDTAMHIEASARMQAHSLE
jgi:branched-chain amino acid aminotransferase